MREIKFRAWSVEDEEMIKNPSLWTDDWADNINDYFKYWQDIVEDDEKIIFMQYTGLKDKNGVEIYEGDIVKVIMDEEESIHQVKWFGDIDYPGFDLDPGWESCGNHLQETQILGGVEIEVIGNIYEHPLY